MSALNRRHISGYRFFTVVFASISAIVNIDVP